MRENRLYVVLSDHRQKYARCAGNSKMCQCRTVSLLLLLLTGVPLINGEKDEETSTSTSTTKAPSSSTESVEEYDPSNAYCFEFTWLGPTYDNTIDFEMNCEDYLSEKHISKDGLCRQPFIITNDSSLPDLQYLWTHTYKTRVVRRQRKGEVCARYIYSFNEEVQNITYLRTKVYAENEGAVTSGCYTQEHSGTESELCLCVPRPGDYFPCNGFSAAISTLSVRWWHASIAALACMLTRRLI